MAADDVLVRVRADIIVRVPNRHPRSLATDGLNDLFRSEGFIVDWGYRATGLTDEHGLPERAEVLDLDPETYREGDAFEEVP